MLYFHLLQQHLIELIRVGNLTEALFFASTELAPRGEEQPEVLPELEKTMALLAFDVPTAPQSIPASLQPLLEPAHRIKTAQEANEALLINQNQGPTPALPGLLRMLAWSEGLLSQKMNFRRLDMQDLLGQAKVEERPAEFHGIASNKESSSEQETEAPSFSGAGQESNVEDVAMEL